MKNLPIAVRLSLGFGVVLLLVITLGMLSWQSMKTMDVSATAVEKAYMPVVTMSSNSSDYVTSLIASAKDFFTYVEEKDHKDTLTVHAKITAEVNATEKLVNSTESLKSLRPIVATLKKLTADYLAIFNEGAAAIALRQKDLATLTLKCNVVQKNVDELLAQLATQILDDAQRNTTTDIPRVVSITRHVTAIGNSVGQVRVFVLRAMTYNNVSHLETMPALIETMLEQVGTTRTEVRNPRSVQLSKEMEDAIREMQTSAMNFAAQWKKSDELGTRRTEVANQLMQGVRNLANTGVEATSKVAAQLSADTAAGANQSMYITLAAVVLGFLVSVMLTKGITGPVGRCLEFAEAVTKGDLGRVLGMHRKDELGRLAAALDAMVGTLNSKIAEADDKSQQARVKEQEALEAMSKAEEATRRAESAKREGMLSAAEQLEGIVSIVSSASEQLSAQIEQSERGSTEQAARVTETATAMEEMNSTVLEVARNAGAASDVSAHTRQKAEHGADVVRRTVENIERVQKQSLELKEDMAVLGQHAQSISEIMGVISDIADQTNLLALNAAIEAARAGEAGRGFAVVADEVRKLAEKTMASTTDVGNAIKAIQNSAEKSIRQVEAAVTDIESSTALAVQSGDSLKEIVSMVDSTADQVRAIATASEEQSATSEEISKAMNQINTIASETARAMGEASHAVSELATQSQALASLIEDLKNQ